KELKPDILLTFGGLIVSKKIKKFLRDYPPKEHWHVNELRAFDTFHALTKHLKIDSLTFFRNFSSLVHHKAESSYESKWIGYRNHTNEKHGEFLKNAPYSDLKVFEKILETIPEETEIQFSNSSVIRYSQLFPMRKSSTVFCNRGTSGIDGSTSTAIGAAYASKTPTTLVTGDLSFFYDSNALWNSYISKDFRIILINNSGGGIFKIIPGPSTTKSLNYFETPHSLTAEHLSKMFGFQYCAVNDLLSLKSELNTFHDTSNTPKLIEIFTPSDQNDRVLKEYVNYLR
ncbi:MAG: 2-succinyl-5-enolpyruvyl-6-hydroxy-3-cyclohexene-1-carboxylate synthase, partial [Flavobacteriaceae bacterium]|nr:2-succinyl-5-enolpyruvyl-6-hydroxy-3-cyclohexene-1-carboxylate synthase [Flavobacteriaceae bacterium]